MFTPFAAPVTELHGRRGGRAGRQREGARTTPRWATPSPRSAPHRRAVPRLQGSEAHGVLGHLPGGRRGLREPARRAREAQLNDSAFTYEPETSTALGFGFRCGYLGLLHMEIVQERLEREYNLTLITTAPSVVYRVIRHQGDVLLIDNPAKLPPVQKIEHARGADPHLPHPRAQRVPGRDAQACQDRRGVQKDIKYLGTRQPRAGDLRDAAGRGGLRLLRQAEERLPRLRLARLRAGRLPGGRPGQAGHPDQRRAGGRASAIIVHRERAYQRGREVCAEAQGGHPEADVRGGHPGGHRREGDLPARPSRRCARTCSPSATAATSAASASSSRSRRRARSG